MNVKKLLSSFHKRPVNTVITWEEIGEKWKRAQLLGWQSVQAALDVGSDLLAKKAETPHGEFMPLVKKIGISHMQSARLMRLAKNRHLIEQAQPESFRKALALLPKGAPRPRGESVAAQIIPVEDLPARVAVMVRVLGRDRAREFATLLLEATAA